MCFGRYNRAFSCSGRLVALFKTFLKFRHNFICQSGLESDVPTELTMKCVIVWDVICNVVLAVGLLCDTEDGGSTFLRNVNEFVRDYIASHNRRQCSYIIIIIILFKLQMGFRPVAVVLQ